MKLSLRHIILVLIACVSARAQDLTYERMATYAYEDMGDWLRRMHGMYLMDYGVTGAPLVLRPWGMNPWAVGVERDGIPWQRVSDGLYDSNLDSPEEFTSIARSIDGLDPLSSIRLRTRDLPSDTATTEVRLREGYYGFGRLDFAHAQSPTKWLSAETRGRFFWYDGLRSQSGDGIVADNRFSEARFYNLCGKFMLKLNERWRSRLEYGGQNVNSRSPVVLFEAGGPRWPEIYSEREYGSGTINFEGERLRGTIGIHARQDRENRDAAGVGKIFGLRERFWYGFAEAELFNARGRLGARVAGESAEFIFDGSNERKEDALSVRGRAAYDFSVVKASSRILLRRQLNEDGVRERDFTSKSLSGLVETARLLGFALTVEGSYGEKAVPEFWRYANYRNIYRPLLISDQFASASYYGGRWDGFEANRDFLTSLGTAAGGLTWQTGNGNAALRWRHVASENAEFIFEADTLHLSGTGGDLEWNGPELETDIPIRSDLRIQSWSAVHCDKADMMRAIDTRSFSRLLYSRDFFKAPLHVNSYVAYELVGRHETTSELETKTVGPAHLLHFRIECTIEGVTLIWGAENLTGQHYEFLPGYMLIRKEEYFGLKWTLRL